MIAAASPSRHRSLQEELDDAGGAVAQRLADGAEESRLVALARPLVLVLHRRVEEAVQVRLGSARSGILDPGPERVAGLVEDSVAAGVHEEVYCRGSENFATEVEARHACDFRCSAGHRVGMVGGGGRIWYDVAVLMDWALLER